MNEKITIMYEGQEPKLLEELLESFFVTESGQLLINRAIKKAMEEKNDEETWATHAAKSTQATT